MIIRCSIPLDGAFFDLEKNFSFSASRIRFNPGFPDGLSLYLM
jgi:hypothetical protein